MLESEAKALRGSYPNIVYKKKLAPLPLFNQNKFPSQSPNVSPTKTKSNTIFASLTPRQDLQASALASPRTFLNEFKTVNNYGRLCDQPFLEFSSFHSEQVFGAKTAGKKVVLEPLKKKKQKITKMFTLRESKEWSKSTLDFGKSGMDFGKSSFIRIHDHTAATPNHAGLTPSHAGVTPKITVNQKPKEKVKDKNKQKENQAIIKKVYKIGDYEAVVGFYSLEVVLTAGEAETQKSFSLRIGKDKLRRIYLLPPTELTSTVLESLTFKDNQLKMKVEKDAKQDRYIGDETYPTKKENLTATVDGKTYKAAIHYPYLEVSIASLNYTEKVVLKPLFLANLYEENFNNLQDYIQKFTLPREVTKTKEEIHHEELKNLPTIIKKVVKTDDFGGLILFKSLEVHLKNTSEVEPETIMHESTLTPMNQQLLKRKKKDVNSVLLRLRLDEVLKLLKCTPEEITNLIKDSVCVEEGTGFAVNIHAEKLDHYHGREKHGVEEFPEHGEKFTIRFNRFLYEGFIKFPTLELYIPETNYKDVIQLKPYQLRDLIDDEFKNVESYLHYFKKPEVQIKPKEEVRFEELRNMPTIIKKVIKTLDFGGLMLFKSLEVHLKNKSEHESETTTTESARKRRKEKDNIIRLKLDEVFKLLKCRPDEITDLVKDSVCVEEGAGVAINIDNEKLDHCYQRHHHEVEEYPENGEKFDITLNNATYEGFIKFPTLELYIPETNYKEVIQLKPDQLRDLLADEFNNVDNYVNYFKRPEIQTETKEEIRFEELRNMPTIVKKVIKTLDFGGLMLFNSLEVHFKNTNEPETPANSESPRKRRKEKDIIRLKLDEVLKLLKCRPQEITDLVKDSVSFVEGTGITVNIDNEKLDSCYEKQHYEVEEFPEHGEKFNVTLNNTTYEASIKFPTLELYIPETSHREVVQLKPNQIRDLLADEFNNVEAYLHHFKKPAVQMITVQTEQSEEKDRVEEEKVIDHHNLHLGDETPREFVQSVEISAIPTPMVHTHETIESGQVSPVKQQYSININVSSE